MREPQVEPREFTPPIPAKLRILAIDGGGIRGLIPAMLLARLERLLGERRAGATLAGSFDLIAGTSTGGLIALGLTMPDRNEAPAMTAAEMVELYRGEEARRIFARPPLRRLPGIGDLSDLLEPKYRLDGLRSVLAERFGTATLADALTGLLVSSYDMTGREPRFLKPWRKGAERVSAVDAGLATSAAPTYFPPSALRGAALVDGGVFVNNPTIAAVIEAMKRTEEGPAGVEELLVVSLGTGHRERGFDAEEVAGWGELGWVLPKDGEPPLIGAMLDGQSDAADHWAHVLLNHRPGEAMPRASQLGAGPRYFRFQVELPEPLPLDGVAPEEIAALERAAERLIAAREAELAALTGALLSR